MDRMALVLKVRKIVANAYANGMLGTMAAMEDIPEGKLREFAEGDIHALTTEELSRISWRAGQ